MNKRNFIAACFFVFLMLAGSAYADVKNVDDSTFKQEVLDYQGIVLVDFWADWCPPCRQQGPIVEALSFKMPEVKFVKINVDNAKVMPARYRIRSIPTLYIFQNGKPVDYWSGLTTEDVIKSKLSRFVKVSE